MKTKRKPFKPKDGPTAIDLHVGKRLRLRRQMLNITQEELAKFVGVTFQQIQKYEGGKNRVSASRLYQFATHLTTKVGFFFDGLDETTGADDETDVMSRETATLIRTFYTLPSETQRAKVMTIMRSIVAALAEKVKP